jgi:hypothetical protein
MSTNSVADELDRLRALLASARKFLALIRPIRTGGIGGQAMTAWTCPACKREQVSGSTATGNMCAECIKELRALVSSLGGET